MISIMCAYYAKAQDTTFFLILYLKAELANLLYEKGSFIQHSNIMCLNNYKASTESQAQPQKTEDILLIS